MQIRNVHLKLLPAPKVELKFYFRVTGILVTSYFQLLFVQKSVVQPHRTTHQVMILWKAGRWSWILQKGKRGEKEKPRSSWSRDKFKVFLSSSWFLVHQATSKCTDYEYAGFHCVPIYQCNKEGVIRIQGLGLLDPRRRGRCSLTLQLTKLRWNSVLLL